MRVLSYQIDNILEGRHQTLHENILGFDLSDRDIDPINRQIYLVDWRNEFGWRLINEDVPALCDYDTGRIYCYHSEKIPLTELRLVHEFLHRAARFVRFFRWCSGVELTADQRDLNEGVTEFLTSRLTAPRYEKEVHPDNRYFHMLPMFEKLEEEVGLDAIVRAYFLHDAAFFERHLPNS